MAPVSGTEPFTELFTRSSLALTAHSSIFSVFLKNQMANPPLELPYLELWRIGEQVTQVDKSGLGWAAREAPGMDIQGRTDRRSAAILFSNEEAVRV